MTGKISELAAFRAPLYVAWEFDPENETLSSDEALAIIDDLAEAGVMVLALSGGEPLLRKDWPRLVARAVERGLTVNVGTNGECISKRTAGQLKRLGVHSVTVRLDSDKAYVHNYLHRADNLFERAARAVRLLADTGIRVVVGFTPSRLNWHDGPGVIALAEKHGASAVNLCEYIPPDNGEPSAALDAEQLRDLLHQWIDMRKRYKDRLEIVWRDCRTGMLLPAQVRRHASGCAAGRLVARILPDGTVTPCALLPTVIGSLKRERFSALWRKRGAQAYDACTYWTHPAEDQATLHLADGENLPR